MTSHANVARTVLLWLIAAWLRLLVMVAHVCLLSRICYWISRLCLLRGMLHLLHILLWHQAWRLAWHRRWLTDTTHHVLWILITEITLISLLICTVRCLNAWINISILLFFYLWWNRLILLYLRLSRCFSHLLYLLEHIKDIVALTLSCIIVSSVIWSLVCGSGM